MTVIVSMKHITASEPYGKRAYLKESVCNIRSCVTCCNKMKRSLFTRVYIIVPPSFIHPLVFVRRQLRGH